MDGVMGVARESESGKKGKQAKNTQKKFQATHKKTQNKTKRESGQSKQSKCGSSDNLRCYCNTSLVAVSIDKKSLVILDS